MSSYYIRILSLLLLLILLTYSCTEPSLSDVRIERFEKLDEQPVRQCYLVHGYHSSLNKEIATLIDRYVCDSIFPYVTIDSTRIMRLKYYYFFKKTKNSNNEETYSSKIKRAIAHRDVIYEYVFRRKDDLSIVPAWKSIQVNDADIIMDTFICE